MARKKGKDLYYSFMNVWDRSASSEPCRFDIAHQNFCISQVILQMCLIFVTQTQWEGKIKIILCECTFVFI